MGIRDSGFSYKKRGARFGIERMQGMGDTKNNHRDYGVESKFKSGWRDLKNPIRDYLMTRRHLPDRLANWLTLKKLNLVGLVQLECLGRQACWRWQNTRSSSSHLVSLNFGLWSHLSFGSPTHLIRDSEKFLPLGQQWPKGEQLLFFRSSQFSNTPKEQELLRAGLRVKSNS